MNLSTLYKKLTNGKYIIGLLIGFIGFISFCSAEDIVINASNIPTNLMLEGSINDYQYEFSGITRVYGDSCSVYVKSLEGGSLCQYSYNSDNTTSTNCDTYYQINDNYPSVNGPFNIQGFYGGCNSYNPNWSLTLSLQGGNTCPEINTGEILSGYILESEIDTNYCVGNGLCPNECGSGEEITGGNRSSIYINDIQYPGAPTIKITIPEEIQRDQNTDEEEVNIDVIGYGYDQDKMQQMVNTQYYKPTAEEMSGLMEKVADFLPLVAVALLITRIRRVLKKVFKF